MLVGPALALSILMHDLVCCLLSVSPLHYSGTFSFRLLQYTFLGEQEWRNWNWKAPTILSCIARTLRMDKNQWVYISLSGHNLWIIFYTIYCQNNVYKDSLLLFWKIKMRFPCRCRSILGGGDSQCAPGTTARGNVESDDDHLERILGAKASNVTVRNER